jgi:hypothetical protein
MLIPTPSLVSAINKAADDYPTKGKLSGVTFREAGMKPGLYAAKWHDFEAEQEWMKVDDWQETSLNEDATKYGIVGRASENTQKLATLRAISRCPGDPQVTADDVKWGYAIVQRSLDNIEYGVTTYMADSEHERLGKAILEAIKNAKDETIHESSLIRRRGIAKFDERARNSALKDLLMTGQVVKVGKAYTVGEAA